MNPMMTFINPKRCLGVKECPDNIKRCRSMVYDGLKSFGAFGAQSRIMSTSSWLVLWSKSFSPFTLFSFQLTDIVSWHLSHTLVSCSSGTSAKEYTAQLHLSQLFRLTRPNSTNPSISLLNASSRSFVCFFI